MLEELSTKIKAQLYDRAGSPLIWTYVISWVSWNFRTVILIVGDGDFDEKIKKVTDLYPSNWDYFLQGICYPFFSSAIFIGVYPFLAMLAFWHWHTQHKKVKIIQQKIEDETPATQEEINALRKASLEREAYLQGEVSRAYAANKEYKAREDEIQKSSIELSDQIKSLTSSINDKNSELNNLYNQVDNLKIELNNLKKEVVNKTGKIKSRAGKLLPQSEVIGKSPAGKKAFNQALSKTQFDHLKANEVEVIIQLAAFGGELSKNDLLMFNKHLNKLDFDYCVDNLLEHNVIYDSGSKYKLTPEWRKVIVDEGFSTLNTLIKNEFDSL